MWSALYCKLQAGSCCTMETHWGIGFELSFQAWVGLESMEWRGKGIADKSKQGEECACCFGESVSRPVWIFQCLCEGS